MAWTHRRMSLRATGSLSSPGSMGTPMYWSRSEASRVSWLAHRSPAVEGTRFGSVASRSLDQRDEGVVAHLGVAGGHGDLAVVEEQDALGHLVGGHPLAEERLDVRLGGLGALLEGDAGHHELVEARIGDADDAGQLHRRAGAQLHLELGGRHVGAAGLDHLGAAALPVHEAVGVDRAGVAGVEEAVGVEACPRPARRGSPSSGWGP